jgi:hypothetical protein
MARQMNYDGFRRHNPEDGGHSLPEWLEYCYFDDSQSPDLTKKDIVTLGADHWTSLRFEPSSRASVREVLVTLWFGASQAAVGNHPIPTYVCIHMES